jgi:transglutaminase-like putative cysteine protease
LTRLLVAAGCLLAALLATLTAFAQDKGYTMLVDRQVYTLEADGSWVGVIESERKAHDAQAARNGGRIDLSYQASLRKLEILEAVTVKADGRRIAVAPDKIIDVAPAVSREVSFYTDLRTRSIVFPDLEAGDSIRYAYRITSFDRIWPGYSWDFYWRPSLRTQRSELILDHPSSMRLAIEQHGTDHRVETSGERTRLMFGWSNPRTIDEEPGATSPYDWAPRVALSTFTSYAEIGDHYGRLHADAARVTPDITKLAAQIVGATTDPREQARLIYDWVSHNIRYVGVEVGQGMLMPSAAADTIKHRYGDCKAYVALMAALLAARGIDSEAVLMNSSVPRYTLPDVPVPSFNHVILNLPQFALYLDPTAQHASFGSLPWGHYDKQVLHANPGKSRLARLPAEAAEDNTAEAYTVVTVGADGHLSGTTRETTRGAMAISLRASATGLNATKAASQLRMFGSPGSGNWIKAALEASAREAMLTGKFELADEIELAAGEALHPPAGLRFMVRPGAFLVGVHDVPRRHPFPCHAGRQVETIEVRLPAELRPSRLPADRQWKSSIAEYRSSYSFADGMLRVRREFVSHPEGQVCQPAQSQELVRLLSNIRRDLRSVVVFETRH